jgi:hypothetical protein
MPRRSGGFLVRIGWSEQVGRSDPDCGLKLRWDLVKNLQYWHFGYRTGKLDTLLVRKEPRCAPEAIFCCPTENSHHLKS